MQCARSEHVEGQVEGGVCVCVHVCVCVCVGGATSISRYFFYFKLNKDNPIG